MKSFKQYNITYKNLDSSQMGIEVSNSELILNIINNYDLIISHSTSFVLKFSYYEIQIKPLIGIEYVPQYRSN